MRAYFQLSNTQLTRRVFPVPLHHPRHSRVALQVSYISIQIMLVQMCLKYFQPFSLGAFQIKHTLLLSPPMSDFSEINGNMPELCPDLVASPMSSRFEEVMYYSILIQLCFGKYEPCITCYYFIPPIIKSSYTCHT